MFLPEEGILFMGDLLFTQFHPYLADGDPSRLLEALKEVSKWEATTLVPGHGPVGRMEDLELFLAYIEECNEIARGLVESGKGDACDEVHVPAMFSHWKMPQFFHANLRFLQQRLGGTRQE